MKLLVLGGTAWLGHEIARAAVATGHEVTCVARGEGVPAGATSIRADRDRDDALEPILASRWDAVIDVGRHPVHVRRAVRDLAPVVERYVLVSSVNVYASHAELGADETAVLLDPLQTDFIESPDDYGRAKVACEDAVLQGIGADLATIVRAGLIGGPGDPTGRSSYWPWRFARPATADGEVLVPDAPELPAAIIDARDLVAWLLTCAVTGIAGTFDAVGEPVPFPEFIEAARSAAHHRGAIARAPEDWLKRNGVNEWAGPRSLPLWLTDRSWYGFNARSSARASEAGLTRRPLTTTLADALDARLRMPEASSGEAGLTDEEERMLLRELLG